MGGFQQANSNSNSNSNNDNHDDDDGNDNNNMLRKTWHFTWRQSEVFS